MCSLSAGRSAVAGGAAGGPGLEPGTALFASRRRVKCAGCVTKRPLLRDGFGPAQALQRQSHHAGAAVPVAVGGPYRRAADGERGDIVRADVGADPAGLLGCAEQFVECLAEPSRRRGQARAWPTRFRGQGVARVLAPVGPVDDLQKEAEERRDRVGAGCPPPGGVHPVVDLPHEYGLQQDLLAGEVPVHGAGADPRLFRDRDERDVQAVFVERPRSGGEHLRAVTAGIGPADVLWNCGHVT